MPIRQKTKWNYNMKRWFPVLAVILLVACENDSYNTGDGRYSYLQAEMVEAYTTNTGVINRVVTDEGTSLQLQPAITTKWATKGDTVYRAWLYYDYCEGASSVKPRGASAVSVLIPIQTMRPDTLRTDPLTLESAWRSTSGKYINLRLAVKTGTNADGEMGIQTIGVKCDTIRTNGHEQFTFTLLHNQNGVPQYYSSTVFASIPLDDRARTGEITVCVNTYQGMATRNY